MIMVDPNKKSQAYNTIDITWLKQMYYTRDPSKYCNGKVLKIKGLHPELLDQGSVMEHQSELQKQNRLSVNVQTPNNDSNNITA